MSWQAGAFALLAVALAGGFAWYEHQRPDARIVALVGTLSAFAALGRIAFAAVPNVKPTTDIVLIAGYALGGGPGFAVGAIAGLTSNFFFGQGPWTPWQMAAWGATGLIGAGLARLMRLRGRSDAGAAPVMGRWPLAIVCGIVGFAYTVVQDVGDWVTYSDHSAAQLAAYVGQGLGFDAIHAAGCVMFALALGPVLTRSIQRFARRLQVEWIAPVASASPGTVAPLIVAVALAAGVASVAAPAPAARATTPTAATAPAAAGGAVTYLLGAENADGGFGAAPRQPSNQLYAGWAALGLASAGRDLSTVTHGIGLMDYIRSATGSLRDVGSLERTILVIHAAGLSATGYDGHDLVAELEQRVRADGSVGEQLNLTAFAVLALRGAGATVGAPTLRWLIRQQDRDGGFGFATAGGSSDADDTGAALEALAGDRAAARVRARAVSFLHRQQNRDGGFPAQPGAESNAQSTAWAMQGLQASGVSPAGFRVAGGASPVGYLESLAAPDGSIRYARGVSQTPVWVTGEALMALEGKPLPVAPPAGRPPQPAPAIPATPAPTRSARSARRLAAARRRAPASRTPAGEPAHPALRRHSVTHPEPPGSVATLRISVSAGGLAGAVGVVTALVLAPVGLG